MASGDLVTQAFGFRHSEDRRVRPGRMRNVQAVEEMEKILGGFRLCLGHADGLALLAGGRTITGMIGPAKAGAHDLVKRLTWYDGATILPDVENRHPAIPSADRSQLINNNFSS
jgi:hypothetical protein